MSDIIIVGVDGEMTGTELKENHKLCQIGIAFSHHITFESDIGWGPSAYVADPKALEVNKFTINRIETGANQIIVDKLLQAFLIGNGGSLEKRILIPVGFNVGRFDMPFIEDALPKSAALFSRRSIDLNAICFAMHKTIYAHGGYPKWSGWKKLAKTYGKNKIEELQIKGSEHNALYDAILAIFCLEFLRKAIVGNLSTGSEPS
jgi:hypothetical protein